MSHSIAVYQGDTKKFTARITDYDKITLIDPTGNNVTFKAINADTNAVVHTATATRASQGVYTYEYTFPNVTQSYYIEFSGTIGGKTHLGRMRARARMRE